MATLTVTLTEALTLNGSEQGGTVTLTASGVNDIYKRIVSCPDDVPLSLVTFKSTVGVAASEQLMDIQLVKYIRITNLDGTNPVILNLLIDTGKDDSAADVGFSLQLEAGKTFMMGSPHDAITADDDAATLSTQVSDLHDLRSISVDPISEAVQLEVFVASA